MKTKTFPGLFYAALIFVIVSTPSCGKTFTTVYERPFNDYLTSHKPADAKIITSSSDGPLEIGYSFTSTAIGIVDKLGVMLPDSGKVFTVSLWDGATEKLLVEKNIKILDPQHFNYVNLQPAVETQVILPGHDYVIGVCTYPVDTVAGIHLYNYNEVLIPPSGNVFPFTGYPHVVNFNQEYIKKLSLPYKPEFPDFKWTFGYVVTGLCDLEFSYVE